MISDDGHEPAFPQGREAIPDWMRGMSLRDWFAGQIICGLAANSNDRIWNPAGDAGFAYEVADAMLKAREQSR